MNNADSAPNWATPRDAYLAFLDKQLYGNCYALLGDDGFHRRVAPEMIVNVNEVVVLSDV
jgi:hypothetical protein